MSYRNQIPAPHRERDFRLKHFSGWEQGGKPDRDPLREAFHSRFQEESAAPSRERFRGVGQRLGGWEKFLMEIGEFQGNTACPLEQVRGSAMSPFDVFEVIDTVPL